MTTSTKDLIERARAYVHAFHGAAEIRDLLCAELERLSQPVGVEPIGEARPNLAKNYPAIVTLYVEVDTKTKLYSAETVARLIAERDAVTAKYDTCIDGFDAQTREIATLQEQAKKLRDVLLAYQNSEVLWGVVAKALAATEPKGEKE